MSGVKLLERVTRVEVIDDTGRAYVKYLEEGEGVGYMLQDDGRTLKVFIDKLSWFEEWGFINLQEKNT